MKYTFCTNGIMRFCAFEAILIISELMWHTCAFQHISSNRNDHSTDTTVSVHGHNNGYVTSIEIAIVCDMECCVSFNFNRAKILDYWNANFRDVHSRFQSLSLSHISFRVTSIFLLERPEEQPFIENVRTENGSLSLVPVLHSFGRWLPSQKNVIRNYDVAVLATGASPGDSHAGIANRSSLCAANHPDGSAAFNVLVIRLSVPCAPLTLAHELAHVLGAPHDEDEPTPFYEFHPLIASHNYVMSEGGKMAHSIFSMKTDASIEKFLKTDQARSCVTNLSSPGEPLIDTAKMALKPFSPSSGISISEQCKIIMNDSSAYSVPGATNCDLSICLRTNSLLDLIFNGFSWELILWVTVCRKQRLLLSRKMHPAGSPPGKFCQWKMCRKHTFFLIRWWSLAVELLQSAIRNAGLFPFGESGFSMEELFFLLWAFYVFVLPICLVVLAWKTCKATAKIIAKLNFLARSI